MNVRKMLNLSVFVFASVGAVSVASAEGLTRAEVRQQLIDAETNGSRFVTDASYPDVSPGSAEQVARQKQEAGGAGPGMSGSSDAGSARAGAHMATMGQRTRDTCVGPAGFCVPYFGN